MRAAVLAAVSCTACFGSGPVPSRVADATVVFAAPAPTASCIGYYVDSVAFGADTGYVETPQYGIQNNDSCNGGSGMDPLSNVQVWSFPLAAGGAMPTMVDAIGPNTAQGTPRLAVTATGVEYISPTDSGLSSLVVGTLTPGSNGAFLPQPSPINGNQEPAAFLADGSGAFAVSWGGYSGYSPIHPNYPSGGANDNNTGVNYIDALGSGGDAVLDVDGDNDEKFACATAYDCVALDPMNLFWFDTGAVKSVSRGGGSAEMNGPLGGLAPVGIATGGGTIAWTVSVDYRSAPVSMTSCEVFVKGQMIFTTKDFSCMGAATDGQYVYFAIVAASNQGGPRIDGVGLGRVSMSGVLEAIALGEQSDGSPVGPRRVYLANGKLWAVDPAVIATFDPDVLAGQHDFQ